MTAYSPIDCAIHDEYEIAIMRKQLILIRWLDDSEQWQQDRVLASDILVKDREEFLIAKSQDGIEHCIRLDKIILVK